MEGQRKAAEEAMRVIFRGLYEQFGGYANLHVSADGSMQLRLYVANREQARMIYGDTLVYKQEKTGITVKLPISYQ